MNKDFVTYELAKKLKEKGFRELCLVYYTNDNTLYYNYSHKAGACYTDCYLSHNLMPKDSVSGKFVDAPTISQVLKWLREEKEIFIRVTLSYDYSTDADGEQVDRWTFWLFEVFSMGSGSLIYTEEISEYDSYEQAALAGVAYCLENLI